MTLQPRPLANKHLNVLHHDPNHKLNHNHNQITLHKVTWTTLTKIDPFKLIKTKKYQNLNQKTPTKTRTSKTKSFEINNIYIVFAYDI